jgi:uncharacterized protein (TIGR00251 family)
MPIKLTSDASGAGGVRLSLKVVPGASRDRIIGALGDALKIAVSKPPEGGAANKAVIKLLAEALGVAEVNIDIVRGHTNPRKEVIVKNVSVEELRARLQDIED